MKKQYNMSEVMQLVPLVSDPLALPDFLPYVPLDNRADFSDNLVRNMFKTRYDSACIYAEDDAAALAYFLTCWQSFYYLHYNDFARVIMSAAEDYDMLYNYDKKIEGTETINPDFAEDGETAKGYSKQTATLHGHTVTRTDGQYEEKTESAAYDATVSEERKLTRGHKVTMVNGVPVPDHDTTANTGTDTVTETEAKRQRKTDMHEYGNIGIQTIPDILLKEVQMRSESMMQAYLDCFVREYCCTYWGGEGEF